MCVCTSVTECKPRSDWSLSVISRPEYGHGPAARGHWVMIERRRDAQGDGTRAGSAAQPKKPTDSPERRTTIKEMRKPKFAFKSETPRSKAGFTLRVLFRALVTGSVKTKFLHAEPIPNLCPLQLSTLLQKSEHDLPSAYQSIKDVHEQRCVGAEEWIAESLFHSVPISVSSLFLSPRPHLRPYVPPASSSSSPCPSCLGLCSLSVLYDDVDANSKCVIT
ncbi:hypothetical protein V8E55_001157 [Tylopilus felleus]